MKFNNCYAFIACVTLYSFVCYGQDNKPKNVLSNLINNYTIGIYMNEDEFIYNSPSVEFHSKLKEKNPDFILFPGERDRYYVTYYDLLGSSKTTKSLYDIWGFNDGNKFFISYKGKPYELIEFGNISLIKFQQTYTQSTLSHLLTNYDNTLINEPLKYKESDYIIYDLKNNSFFPYNSKYIKKIISRDPELYEEYLEHKKTKKNIEIIEYLRKYNIRNAALVTSYGIKIP